MNARFKLLTVLILLVTGGCLAAGTKAITDAGTISRIEVGRSTQADVAALLGYPLTASSGEMGEETWHFTCVTATPTPPAFVPLIKAYTPNLRETTRELAVTFSRDGTVKSVAWVQPPPPAAPAG